MAVTGVVQEELISPELIAALPEFDPRPALAQELNLPLARVNAAVALFTQGGTVPFIARYRKEATGGLDEVQLHALEERQAYLQELDQRRRTILATLAEQGKLTPALRDRLLACATKNELEDLYLPFKPKRRTRATIARERGLEPLAELILSQPAQGDPRAVAAPYVDAERGVPDVEAALAGARDILAERLAEHAACRAYLRETLWQQGFFTAAAVPDKTQAPTKFENYYQFREAITTLPSHRYLAIRRGEEEGVLKSGVELDPGAVLPQLERLMGLQPRSPLADQLRLALEDGFRRLLHPSVENDVRAELKERSDRAAVEIFASNLRNLLLAPPLGERAVVGLDPGLRTGCKCAALDATGRFLETVTIFPGQGAGATERARQELLALLDRHRPDAIAVGNGTGGREAEAFVRQVVADWRPAGSPRPELFVVSVNESGASVYSASEVAREEHPDLDLTVRGAISIGRRLQDPLAELVKIDPKAIGVGQYQHDVHQPLLRRHLDEVVESCVNQVGVEVNTASPSLLSYVAGIGPALAKKIVRHRETHGPFHSRQALRTVSGVGPRTFEQAAGFLRVRGGAHPLDGSAVHPERYELVERMARDLSVPLAELVGNPELADRLRLERYVGGDVGEPTLRDILAELKKPGRDPRARFEPPRFREDVRTLEDVRPGMVLEGVVTNVTAFGAFVDIGVHHDGLVHVSQLADRFVRDPATVVKTGDRLTVRVLEVDLPRRRLSLSARTGEPGPGGKPEAAAPSTGDRGAQPPGRPARDQDRDRDRGRNREAPRSREPDRDRGASNPPPATPGHRPAPPSPDSASGAGAGTFGYNPFRDLKKRFSSD